MMKRTIKAATLSTGLILSLMSGVVVDAEGTEDNNLNGKPVDNWYDATTSPADAKSIGQFEIVAEDPDNPDDKDGKLTLDRVPSMNFGQITVRKVSDEAVTLDYVDGAVQANDTAYDGNVAGQLQISDYRGTAGGWRLNVALGTFTKIDATGVTISNATLKLQPKVADAGNADTPKVAAPVDIAMGQSLGSNVINTTTTTRGQGKNMYQIDADTKLAFERQNIQEGTYQADITWTLVNAPS